MKTVDDTNFSKEWQKLYAEHQGLNLDSFSFSCEYGSVDYVFCKRSIEIHGIKFPYEDIVTPCGFNGPYLTPAEDSSECKRMLAHAFNDSFQKYCNEQRIVAEYVQFNPWNKNHEPFREIYDVEFRCHTLAIDLTKDNLFMDELDGRRRRSVRNAVKQGVQIFYDDSNLMVDEFLRLYDFTIQKYGLSNYYHFNHRFIEHMFTVMKGKICFAYAMYQGKCVSICILIKNGEYIHYHLAANDPAESKANGSSLLIYDIAEKAQKSGYKYFDLGGANGSLLEFKQTFTRSGFTDYYVGKKIRNQEIYDMLVAENGIGETAFFPAYRDNGKIRFNNPNQKNEKCIL